MLKKTLSFVLLGGCLVGDAPVTKNGHIIGGTDDGGDPAVGMLRMFNRDGSQGACTATLIAPEIMVTAAHCATGFTYDVSFDAQPDVTQPAGAGNNIRAVVIANPAYDGVAHDVAIVRLLTPSSATPIAIGAAPAAGAQVRVVGYGKNVFGEGSDPTGAGTKRAIGLTVDSVADHEIVIGSDGASTCHGDSGGPVFDASGAIVATVSSGDTSDCHGASHDMRLDDNLDFLGRFLAVGSGSGSDAGAGSGTTSTTCDITVDAFEIRCTDADCTCVANGQVVGTCTAADPSDACNSDCCGF